MAESQSKGVHKDQRDENRLRHSHIGKSIARYGSLYLLASKSMQDQRGSSRIYQELKGCGRCILDPGRHRMDVYNRREGKKAPNKQRQFN